MSASPSSTVETRATSERNEPSNVLFKRPQSPDSWGVADSKRRRQQLGMERDEGISPRPKSEADRSLVGTPDSQHSSPITHENSRISEGVGANRRYGTRSPELGKSVRGSSISAATISSSQAGQALLSFTYSTFPRSYNKLIWPKPRHGAADEEVLLYNSRRWSLNDYAPASRKQMKAIEDRIAAQLKDETDILRAKLTFTFPRDDQTQYVEVHFSTFKAYLQAGITEVQWRNRPLELARSSHPTLRKQTIITVHQVNPRRVQGFWHTIRSVLDDVAEFQHAWARRQEQEWTGGHKPPPYHRTKRATEPAMSLIFLVKFRSERTAKDLPGYIKDEYGTHFPLHFEGRPDSCTFCKANAIAPHTLKDCWSKMCSQCGIKGHLADECKTAVREEDELDL